MPDRPSPPQVRIEPYGESDLILLVRNNSPEMTEHLGGPESEAELQDRGIGTAAVRAVVDHARTHGNRRARFAYPSVTNPPSKAICQKAGFDLMCEHDFEYPPGNWMRCNEWRIGL